MALNFYLVRYDGERLFRENYGEMNVIYHIKNVASKEEAVKKLVNAKFLEEICDDIMPETFDGERKVHCGSFCTPPVSVKVLDPENACAESNDYDALYLEYIYGISSPTSILALFKESEGCIDCYKLINADEEFVQFMIEKKRITTQDAIVLETK